METGIIYCYFNPINEKRYIGQTTNERSQKAVLCFTKSGEFIKEFICQGDACEWLGRNRRDNAQISKCCNQETKSAHGYVWKFK